jgi:hypothetical protein
MSLVAPQKRLKLRILDFDIENRPLSYLGSDFTTSDITAIAWKFIGERGKPTVVLLGRETQREMLEAFNEAYAAASMVTGHYIRKHDLPIINGALMEHGLPLLGDKLTQDTKLDLVKRSGISASQESLGGMLGIKAPKVSMDQTKWRAANRLEPAGLLYAEKRCAGDVRQHIAMRAELLRRGMLRQPSVWRSTQVQSYGGYTP